MILKPTQHGAASSQYRACGYRQHGPPIYRYLSADGQLTELDRWLRINRDQGAITGGLVQMYVPRFGWLAREDYEDVVAIRKAQSESGETRSYRDFRREELGL